MNHKHRNLFKTGEWEHFIKMGSAMHDPEEKKAFYETVISKKEADPSYSLFTDFPRSEGLRICSEILEMLKGRRPKEKDSA